MEDTPKAGEQNPGGDYCGEQQEGDHCDQTNSTQDMEWVAQEDREPERLDVPS